MSKIPWTLHRRPSDAQLSSTFTVPEDPASHRTCPILRQTSDAVSADAGGGPPPAQNYHESDEEPDNIVPAEVLFSSIAAEPYETVFSSQLHIGPLLLWPPGPVMPLLSPPVSGPSSFMSTKGPSSLTSTKEDPELLIHNMDTGERRRLGEGALTKSFLNDSCGCYTHPQQLAGSTKPWVGWWAAKHAKDESLWLAAESGNIVFLRQALEKPEDGSAPASVNSPSVYSRTALHLAAAVCKSEGVELLLDAGADTEARTDAGLTALHIASQHGHLGVMVLLLDWNADIRAETNDADLPLHFAAMNGHANVVRLLLDRGEIDQLHVRNSRGQCAAEVSSDVLTAETFNFYESGMSACSHTSDGIFSRDRYAGRTAFNNVLLRNARTDAVIRLLYRTQNNPDMNWSTSCVETQPPGCDLMKSRPGPSERTPRDTHFAQLRRNGPGIAKVGPDSFLLIERIGKGSFGEVFQVKHKETGHVYAMKILKKNKVMIGNLLRYAVTERNVLSYIRHPYMVSLHYAFQTRGYLVLVMEFCPGGNLQQVIERMKKLPEPLAQLYTAETLLALIHLHERRIVFRDLKPDNVVIDAIGHAMVTDFGLSKEGVSALHGTRSFCGSVAFLAPEILERKGHNHTVDIYGVGVMLYDMLTGWPPFYDPNRERLYKNIKHQRLVVPQNVAEASAAFIYAVMEREPSHRLGAADSNDVKKHHYFDNIDFEALMRREVPVPLSSNPGTRKPAAPSPNYVPSKDNPFVKCRVTPPRESENLLGWSFADYPR